MAGFRFEMRPVDRITEQRMAGMGEMDPDLVRAPRLQPAGQQRGDRLAIVAVEGLADFPMGDRLAPTLAHRHFLPRMRMPVDRRDDRAVRPTRYAPDKGEIAALHGAGPAVIGELRRQ